LQSESATKRNKRNQDGGESASKFSECFDHGWLGFIAWIPLLPFLFPGFQKTPNVKVTGAEPALSAERPVDRRVGGLGS
jgi:hypothetical protein